MSRIAFLGTGLMGAPMAQRLLEAGHDLTVWNRTPTKAEALSRAGARVGTSPADAVRGAEVVVTMLADPTALEEVAFGREGFASSLAAGLAAGRLAAHPAAGTIFVDMSTVGPECFLSVAERLPEGTAVLDAPVLGSVPQATDGTLEIFAGGDKAVYETAFAVLATMGRPSYAGPSGSGAALKLVVNAALVSLQCTLGECLSLGDAFGLPQAAVLDALAASSLAPVVEKKRALIESGDFTARFTVDNGAKDAELVDAAARSRGVRLLVAAAAKEWYAAARAAGLGAEDYSAVVKAIRAR